MTLSIVTIGFLSAGGGGTSVVTSIDAFVSADAIVSGRVSDTSVIGATSGSAVIAGSISPTASIDGSLDEESIDGAIDV